jgi:hypothetical protein
MGSTVSRGGGIPHGRSESKDDGVASLISVGVRPLERSLDEAGNWRWRCRRTSKSYDERSVVTWREGRQSYQRWS